MMLEEGLQRYLSAASLERLASVRVGIAGAGGLGSNCAMLLARSGIRHFTIVDFDRVEASNLNRQFYFPEDVGQPKVEALGRNLRRIEPELNLRLINQRLADDSLTGHFADCAVVVEALDRAEYKAVLCNRLVAAGVFVVSASGMGGFGGPVMQKRHLGEHLVCVGDFSTQVDAAHPPLAPRVMQAAALQADAVLEFILSGAFV